MALKYELPQHTFTTVFDKMGVSRDEYIRKCWRNQNLPGPYHADPLVYNGQFLLLLIYYDLVAKCS